MIYGKFGGDKNANKRELEKLENHIKWPQCRQVKKDIEGLTIGILTDDRLPYKIKEQYSLKNGILTIFSGCLYNRNELIQVNHISPDISDVDLVSYLFLKKGRFFVDKLNGDFVILIYLIDKKEIYLYRDHLGVRPLCYYFSCDTIWFSSDENSLCKTFGKKEKVLKDTLLKYFKMVDYSRTPFSNIKKLLPGHFLQFSKEQLKIEKYWFPERIKYDWRLNKEKLLNDMRFLIRKSVSIRSDKKFQAATHLSGGLDSGIVSAFAKENFDNQNSFMGFSWSPQKQPFVKDKFDERNLVLEQCNLNEIIPHFIDIKVNDFLKYISNPNHFSRYFHENKIIEEAKKQGINLLFSGHGGDEFVSIGERGINQDLLMNLKLKQLLKRYPLSNFKSLLRVLLYEIFFPFMGILPPPIKKDLYDSAKYLLSPYKKPTKTVINNFYLFKSRRKLQLGFINCYYLPARMEEWYINGVRNGVEYRYPLLDKNLIEYILKTPSTLLYKGKYSRSIIREISTNILPENVRWKNSGEDPVTRNHSNEMVYECAELFLKELDTFKQNPELAFMDFDLIEKDIKEYKITKDKNKYSLLLFNIFYLKQIHEFLKIFETN